MKMIFQDIPKIDVPGTMIDDAVEYGAGTYVYQAEGIDMEHYRSYLAELEDSGFQKHVDNDKGLHGVFYNVVFRKDDRILSVLYIQSLKRVYITVSESLLEKEWNAKDVFESVPDMDVASATKSEAVDYGAGNYVVTIEGTSKEEYLFYLTKLEAYGFMKYADNGDGLEEKVYHSIYRKDRLNLSVTYVEKLRKTYLSACFDLPLSEHLLRPDEYKKESLEHTQTKLHMLEMFWSGNSFVIQLKNGHFIVSDGGTGHEIGYLFDYLEKLTLVGTKPVIEAWFISHAHIDHSGVLRMIAQQPKYADRVYVEGIYYNEPNSSVIGLDPSARAEVALIREATRHLKTTTGLTPEVYRPQTGQRYYFSDITVDIILGQEQLPFDNYSGDFNDSSTWCMFTIEGQKCLLAGDGDKGGMKFVMEAYDRDFMKLDLFTVLHHGHNTRDMFTDYCETKTVLLTRKGDVPAYRKKENNHLKEVSKEWFSWNEGTRVFTFPYTLGTSELLPHFEWIYHKGQERPN